jgi:hypothetical protein
MLALYFKFGQDRFDDGISNSYYKVSKQKPLNNEFEGKVWKQ